MSTRWLTKVGSTAWAGVNHLAREGVRRGWVTQTKLPSRVISVGNLQAGGTGKTPLVIRIARESCSRGLTTLVLTRGYRGEWEKEGGLVRPRSALVDPRLAGDEPVLIQERVPDAWIGVGSDRLASYATARAAMGRDPEVVVLDDGFQQFRIARDLDVITVTSHEFGESWFRDRAEEARGPTLWVWTKGEEQPSLPSGAECLKARVRLSPSRWDGPCWLISGVGDSAGLEASVREAGYRVEKHWVRGDHAVYERAWLDERLEEARRESIKVLTTGKDWVKWRALGIPSGEVWVLEPELEWVQGGELWERRLWGR